MLLSRCNGCHVSCAKINSVLYYFVSEVAGFNFKDAIRIGILGHFGEMGQAQ